MPYHYIRKVKRIEICIPAALRYALCCFSLHGYHPLRRQHINKICRFAPLRDRLFLRLRHLGRTPHLGSSGLYSRRRLVPPRSKFTLPFGRAAVSYRTGALLCQACIAPWQGLLYDASSSRNARFALSLCRYAYSQLMPVFLKPPFEYAGGLAARKYAQTLVPSRAYPVRTMRYLRRRIQPRTSYRLHRHRDVALLSSIASMHLLIKSGMK